MRKDQQHNLETESTIFSEHKSSVQIAEERKAWRAAEKARRKEERANRPKTTMKDPGTRITVIALSVLVGVVLLGVGLIIANQTRNYAHEIAGNSAHFYSNDYPELSTEGIKGVISEAYYTNDGSFCLKLTLSNGLDAKHYLTSLEVVVKNEDGETIATGYSDAIPSGFYIEPENVSPFTFYIESKYVKIADDDLDELTYELNTTGEIDAEAAKTMSTTSTTEVTK